MNQTHSSLQGQLLKQCPRCSHQPPWHWHLPKWRDTRTGQNGGTLTRTHEKTRKNRKTWWRTDKRIEYFFDWKANKTYTIIIMYNSLSLDWMTREIHEYIPKVKKLTAISLQLFVRQKVWWWKPMFGKHSSTMARNLSKPGPSLLSFRAQVAVIDPRRLAAMEISSLKPTMCCVTISPQPASCQGGYEP